MNNILMYKVNDELVISARDLSNELGLRESNFNKWFEQQTSMFVENQEFGVFILKDENPLGGRPQKNYWLTLDTAKHIALMSRTEKGREYRTRLIELEKEHSAKQPQLPQSGQDMMGALEIMARMLNLPESGKVKVMKIGMQDYPRFVQALPDYTVDRPVIDNHVASNVVGSSDTTHAMSYHIKDKGIELGIRKVNTLLVQKGMLEIKSRPSSNGGHKNFKALTEKGLRFGKNITSDKNPRESSPHYYDSMIDELFEEIKC